MTDPVARDRPESERERLADILRDNFDDTVRLNVGFQADPPDYFWRDQADALLAAGVRPPDTLSDPACCPDCERTHPWRDHSDAAIEAASDTPEPPDEAHVALVQDALHREYIAAPSFDSTRDDRHVRAALRANGDLDEYHRLLAVPPPAAPGLPAELRALSEAATAEELREAGWRIRHPSGLWEDFTARFEFREAAVNYVRALAKTPGEPQP